ncbi:MAG: MFS transporter [Chloroflexi bacterium]|nr:MAG: MFS transporter [Chloroflexota bacterium]
MAIQPPLRLPGGVFYGWVIVAVSFWGNWITAPLNPVVFSIFIVPIRQDLGVTLGTLAWCITFRQISAGISAPFLGRFVDKYGPRWVGVICAAWAGSCLIALSQVTNIWMMYSVFFISGFSGFGVFGGGQILTGVPPANWFIVKRGRAVSYAQMGGGLGTASWVVISSVLVTTIGWRNAWLMNGLLIAGTLIPMYGFLMRRRPEDVGLYPDGADAPVIDVAAARPIGTSQPAKAAGPVEVNFTLREATRTWALWLITIAFMFHTFATNGVLFLRVPFWQSLGVAAPLIGLAVASDPFVVMLCTLLFGYMAERVPVRLITASGGAWRALSMVPLLLGRAGGSWVFGHNIIWGIGSAGMGTGQNLVIPAYFGRVSQGAIRGYTAPIMIGAGALSAPLVGFLSDAGVPPTLIFSIAGVMMAIAGGIFLFVQPPAPPVRTEAAQAAAEAAARAS